MFNWMKWWRAQRAPEKAAPRPPPRRVWQIPANRVLKILTARDVLHELTAANRGCAVAKYNLWTLIAAGLPADARKVRGLTFAISGSTEIWVYDTSPEYPYVEGCDHDERLHYLQRERDRGQAVFVEAPPARGPDGSS